jgi:thiamine-phosphate pyrophosphorylase
VRLPDPPIFVITDRTQCDEPLENRAEALFRGGCRWLSLREKDLPAAERAALLARLMRIGTAFGAAVGVHDDIAAAAHCGSALHLPAAADPAAARPALGGAVLIGQSCHDRAELDRAGASGVDYVTLGAAFPSASKPGYAPRSPIDAFALLAGTSAKPVLALGGVTESTVGLLAGISIAGVAVMGRAMRTPEPAAWFSRLAERWRTGAPS